MAAAVLYDANGGAGTLADPSSPYAAEAEVTVLGPGEDITRADWTFIEWNTAADGSGDEYEEDDTFVMPDEEVTLYAQWEEDETVVEVTPADVNSDGAMGAGGVVSFTGLDTLKITPCDAATGQILLVIWNTAAQMKSLTFQTTTAFQGEKDDAYVQVVPAAADGMYGWLAIRIDLSRFKLSDGTVRCETSTGFTGMAAAFRLR